jgi:hypothetical protein
MESKANGRKDDPKHNEQSGSIMGVGQPKAARRSVQSPTMRAAEWDHRRELQMLEEAIERKRNELKAHIEREHEAQKARLVAQLQSREHDLIALDYDFRSRCDKLMALKERLALDRETRIADHGQAVARLEESHNSATECIFSTVEAEIELNWHLQPVEAQLEGRYRLIGLCPRSNANEKNGVLQQTLKSLRLRIRHTSDLHDEELDELASELKQRELRWKEKLHRLDEELECSQAELIKVEPLLQKTLRDLESDVRRFEFTPMPRESALRQKILRDVDCLKKRLKELSSSSLSVEEFFSKREKVSDQAQEKIIKQKNSFFEERNGWATRCATLARRSAMLDENERHREQVVFRRLQALEQLLCEAEVRHSALMNRKKEAHCKHLDELQRHQKDKETHLAHQLDLLERRTSSSRETFNHRLNLMKTELSDSNQRVEELTAEVRGRDEQKDEFLHAIECCLAETLERSRFFRAMLDGLKEDSKRELAVLQDALNNFQSSFEDQRMAKEYEITTLKDVLASFEKKIEAREAEKRSQLEASTAKGKEQVDSLNAFMQDVSHAIEWMEERRCALTALVEEERETANARSAASRTLFEEERERLHRNVSQERELAAKCVVQFNAKIREAQEKREQLTADFQRDLNEFTRKAVSAGASASTHRRINANLEAKIDFLIQKIDEIAARLRFLRQRHCEKLRQQERENEVHMADLKRRLEEKRVAVQGRRALTQQLFDINDNCSLCQQTGLGASGGFLRDLHEELSKWTARNNHLKSKLTILCKKGKKFEKTTQNQLRDLEDRLRLLPPTKNDASQKKLTLEKRLRLLRSKNNDLKKRIRFPATLDEEDDFRCRSHRQ